MVPERDHDRATRNTTKTVHNNALRSSDNGGGSQDNNFEQNYWSKLDHKDNDMKGLPGLEDGQSGSADVQEESQLKSSNLAKLGPAVGVPYPSMMDANIQNLQQVVFGGKKGKPTPSVQTAQPALQRANNRTRTVLNAAEATMKSEARTAADVHARALGLIRQFETDATQSRKHHGA